MANILLIDDEPIYFKMVVHALKPQGHEVDYAKTGLEGLSAVQRRVPDVIITDVRLPDISGYEVAQRLRRDPRFSSIPIVFLTSQSDLSNKLKAFEVGADDYLSKPFQPEELVARIGSMVRRGEALRAVREMEVTHKESATMIATHSLRGGVGCSSIALNTALAFKVLWNKPTLVVDAVFNAGQIALMLNATPVHTWADLSDLKTHEIDEEVIHKIISKHACGLDYIAAPVYPIASDTFPEDFWQVVLQTLKDLYEFIIVDIPHDFSNISIQMLDASDYVLLPLAPEMASIRAAVCAFNIYDRLGYTQEKVIPVLNNTFQQAGIKQNQIEKVLKRPIGKVLPHVPNEFTKAINFGDPFILANPDSPVSYLFEDSAYAMSKDSQKNIPPAIPSAAWKRVSARLAGKK
jgi:pilus assembly protein CpaE